MDDGGCGKKRDLPIVQTDTQTLRKQVLEILEEAVVDEIPSGLESIVNVIVGLCVIDTHTQCILHLSHIQEIREVLRGSGVITRMSDVIGASARILVVRALDIVSAHVLGLRAESLGSEVVLTGFSGFAAVLDVFETAAAHVQSELHVVVDGVIDGFNAVGVVDGEFRVMGCLDGLIDDAVSDTQSVKVEFDAGNGSIGDELVLVIEVVEERRSCN